MWLQVSKSLKRLILMKSTFLVEDYIAFNFAQVQKVSESAKKVTGIESPSFPYSSIRATAQWFGFELL
jgi:hypothetical protein